MYVCTSLCRHKYESKTWVLSSSSILFETGPFVVHGLEDFLLSAPISWITDTCYWVQVLCGFWNSNSGSQSCTPFFFLLRQGSSGYPRPNFVVQAGLRLRVHVPPPNRKCSYPVSHLASPWTSNSNLLTVKRAHQGHHNKLLKWKIRCHYLTFKDIGLAACFCSVSIAWLVE